MVTSHVNEKKHENMIEADIILCLYYVLNKMYVIFLAIQIKKLLLRMFIKY